MITTTLKCQMFIHTKLFLGEKLLQNKLTPKRNIVKEDVVTYRVHTHHLIERRYFSFS